MARIVHLKPRPPQDADVAALCSRLSRLESASSPDENIMDAIAAAEQRMLAALGRARCTSTAELALKLATLARRANAADGILNDGEMTLLTTLADEVQGFTVNAARA